MTSEFLRPTLNRISLPPSCCTTKIDSNGDTILPSLDILTSLLSSEECKSLIIAHDIEAELHDISGTYTTRLRKVFDDEVLADLLWSRLSQFYEKLRVVDEEGQTWCAEGLNQCFRFCKYRAGDGFGAHIDGRRLAALDSQSFMTVTMYLNTVPVESGGATRFLEANALSLSPSSEQSPRTSSLAMQCVYMNQPVQGSAAVFRDDVYHDGEVITDGIKYLLRTDMMFRRERPFNFAEMYPEEKFEVKQRARKALELARRLEDGGNRDDAVKWYKVAFRLDEELERAS